MSDQQAQELSEAADSFSASRPGWIGSVGERAAFIHGAEWFAARVQVERPDEQTAKVEAANRYNSGQDHHGQTERNAFWKGWDEHAAYLAARLPEQPEGGDADASRRSPARGGQETNPDASAPPAVAGGGRLPERPDEGRAKLAYEVLRREGLSFLDPWDKVGQHTRDAMFAALAARPVSSEERA